MLTLDNSDEKTILNVLENILVQYGTEYSIKSIVNSTLLNTLYRVEGHMIGHLH